MPPQTPPPDRPRPRALRGPVRRAHAGHDVLRDARPHGDHRAARGHLARRRAARHLDVPARELRGDHGASPPRRAPSALQYGPTEGLAAVKDCIAEVMAAEGMRVDPDDMLVTTGGQQVIDLVCKTLIDPGDVDRRRGADVPGRRPVVPRLPGRRRADRDGRRRHADRRARGDARPARAPRAGAPKFIYTVPTFQNPAGVTMSLPRRRRLVEVAARARAARARGQPVRAAALRGRRRCRRCTRSTAATSSSTSGTFSKILSPGHAPGLGRRAARRCSRRSTSASRRADLCSVVDDPVLRRRPTSSSGAGATTSRRSTEHLPAPARRDARRARRALPARGDVDAARRAGCSSGRRCPTTSTRPTCWPARCARTSRSCPAARRSSTAAAARRCG